MPRRFNGLGLHDVDRFIFAISLLPSPDEPIWHRIAPQCDEDSNRLSIEVEYLKLQSCAKRCSRNDRPVVDHDWLITSVEAIAQNLRSGSVCKKLIVRVLRLTTCGNRCDGKAHVCARAVWIYPEHVDTFGIEMLSYNRKNLDDTSRKWRYIVAASDNVPSAVLIPTSIAVGISFDSANAGRKHSLFRVLQKAIWIWTNQGPSA